MEMPLTVRRELLRYVVAAAFLFFLLAEWGSHAMVHINNSTSRAVAVSAGLEHSDNHGSLILCNDDGRRDEQVPNVGHDLTPTVRLTELLISLAPQVAERSPLPLSHTALGLTRPPEPHFHPPELV